MPLYLQKSPFYRLDRVRTPTLIFFGTEDKTVATQQGWMHYRALQELGKTDVRFLLFPGEKHLLEKLVHRPIASSDATGPAIVRLIEAWEPTLLVDEYDSMRYPDSLRNVFNSGFGRGKQTIRVDGVYNTFAPFAVASTFSLSMAG